MQLRELKKIDDQLKQIILAIIIRISESKEHIEDQMHHHKELHSAFENNLLTYVLVSHFAKI